ELGIATKVTELLDNAAIDYVLYDGIVPNPTIQNVKDGVAFVKEAEADCLIANGGGAPIDTAKAIGIILTNPEFSDV
ncbi:iron-containing alcohol dehydrogenase, partial [Enterococcus faecium]|uniref:iron-containing alcohol dehydrogenase n=1 Tax=Enterococcus faecium TaxID=1352 RepID=UPI003CC50958